MKSSLLTDFKTKIQHPGTFPPSTFIDFIHLFRPPLLVYCIYILFFPKYPTLHDYSNFHVYWFCNFCTPSTFIITSRAIRKTLDKYCQFWSWWEFRRRIRPIDQGNIKSLTAIPFECLFKVYYKYLIMFLSLSCFDIDCILKTYWYGNLQSEF